MPEPPAVALTVGEGVGSVAEGSDPVKKPSRSRAPFCYGCGQPNRRRRKHVMAKNGFKMIDAEMHVMEPVDLWERYIEPEFKPRAPRRLSERRWDIRTVVEGEVMASMPGGDWPAHTDAEEKALGDRYAEEIARNFDPESQVRAMDKEGLDLAILFPTSAMYVTAFDTMDARFAAAACRAYNDWLHDYIEAADPKRLFGAAAISPHDVTSAVAETRRAVTQLGMKAIFLRPNIFNSRPWHDRYYDPLWSVCQELNLTVGFHETTGSRMKAAGCEVVDTCLPGPKEMEQVTLGPKGILEGVRPGALYIDHTTNSPLLVRRVHDALAARNVDMLDAPVSGGTEGAQTRDLLVMVGGET